MSVSLPDSLDEGTKRELMQFVESENAKLRFQQTVHQLTDLCFPKCISKPGARLEKSEEACIANCVDRFLDTSAFMVQRLEEIRHQGA